MDFAKLMAAQIKKGKESASSTTPGGAKYLKRSEIEAQRQAAYRAEQEAEEKARQDREKRKRKKTKKRTGHLGKMEKSIA